MRKPLPEARADYAEHMTKRPVPPEGWFNHPHSSEAMSYQKALQQWVTQSEYLQGRITAAEFPLLVLDREPKAATFNAPPTMRRERTPPRPRKPRKKRPLTDAERRSKAAYAKRIRDERRAMPKPRRNNAAQ